MNFILFPCEIPKINKRGGGQNKLRGGLQKSQKYKRPPVYFEPESKQAHTQGGALGKESG